MASKVLLISLCLFGAAHCVQDQRYVEIVVDGKNYDLNLIQDVRHVAEDNIPIFDLKSSGGSGYSINKVAYTKRRLNGYYFNDATNVATFLVIYDQQQRKVLYDGVISTGTTARAVKFAQDENGNVVDPPSSIVSALVSNNAPLNRALTTLNPKIVVAVDNQLYTKLGSDFNEVFKYVSTFFNAVNLRFSALTSANISVTGVVVATDGQVKEPEKVKQYFNGQFSKDTGLVGYDVVVVLTTANVDALKGINQSGSTSNKSYSILFEKDDAAFGGLYQTINDLSHLYEKVTRNI